MNASIKYYEKGDRLYVQSQQIWQILVGVVGLKRNFSNWGKGYITYADVCELMGKSRMAARTIDRQLGIIATFCRENNIPALNAIVINNVTGEPGHEVMLSTAKNLKKEQKNVLKYDWFSVRPPSVNRFRETYENGKKQ